MFLHTVLLILPATVLAWPTSEALKALASGNHKFAAQSYQELIKTQNGNIVVSPISAETVLSLVTEGARGSTAVELIRGLSLPSSAPKRRKGFQCLEHLLNESIDDFQLLSANKVYIALNFAIESSFKKIATDVYGAEVQNVNFTDSVATANLINQWVAIHTNNKIQGLVTPNQLNSLTVMILVNTLYLDAKWVTPFSTSRTTNSTFYTSSDSSEEVATMHSRDFATYNYCYNAQLKAKFLDIPYNNSNVSMTFILPDDRDGLPQVEANLAEYLKPQNFIRDTVGVAIPTFSISTTINFNPILTNLGIEDAFSPSQANFTGISKEVGVYIDFVVQKAFINVTETGTVAAAATAVGIGITAVPPPPRYNFIADHPFLYYIQDHRSGVILFIGRFNNKH